MPYQTLEQRSVHYHMLSTWELHKQIDTRKLREYYLLYWNPVYFDAVWNEGIITRKGIDYHVVYHNCKSADLRNYKQIALSFRAADEVLGIPNYVLVKGACK